jgi:hypothetical protein
MLLACLATSATAQESVAASDDGRTQYPAFLANSYFTVNLGSMRYIFSNDQLSPGLHADAVEIPHLAARIDLFGHHFTKNLSAQVTYMRPARYVVYRNINGDGGSHQVSMAYGGFTLVWQAHVTQSVSAYGEAGLGVTSRSGFDINDGEGVQPAHFAAGILGAGLAFHASENSDIMFGATYSPSRKSYAQPSVRLFTAGLRYEMRPLPEEVLAARRSEVYFFPLNVARFGYTTNALSYGVNTFFTEQVPVFWAGDVETRRGFTLDLQRNLFHTRSVFAFNVGLSASYWKSEGDKELFRTLSIYPLLQFFFLRKNDADFYFNYSLAGPTYVTSSVIDGEDTGEHFTFQDFLGAGAFFGRNRRFNAELGVKHYSNGNIFVRNAGIKIPLTFSFGVAF